ncbi:MAG: PKD domain-containing protein [Flavobacteriales bacterium]|nr:PKD domain-containing protein [Flavobacteriales bacterium]
MLRTLRASTLALASILCGAAHAQPAPPYTVTINGSVLGCNTANGYVNITTMAGTLPEVDIDVPLGPSCGWSVTLTMDSYSGGFMVSTPCNGAIVSGVGQYQSDFLSTATINLTLDCGNNPPPCNACLSLSQTTTGGNPNGGGDPVPFSVDASNCSFGGAAPYTYIMNWDDTTIPDQSLTHVYAQAGTYIACLTITDAEGCTSTDCDTVVVAEDGTIDPVVITACEAGFFVMQAYEWVNNPGTPNGGGGQPVPNELWVWNLSNGGSGEYTYSWDFGDGSVATDPFPTHTYPNPGTYLLCLSIDDNAGCVDTYCESITVDEDGILGGLTAGSGNRSGFTIRVMNALSTNIGEGNAFTQLRTWPNPVQGDLNVSLVSSLKGSVRMRITDLSGRAVLTESLGLNNGKNTLTVPVAGLSAGAYVIELSNGTNTVSSRFMNVR